MFAQRPMSEADALRADLDDEVPDGEEESCDAQRQQSCLSFTCQAKAGDEEDIQGGQFVDRSADRVDPLAADAKILPVVEQRIINHLRAKIEAGKYNSPPAPVPEVAEAEENQQYAPE